MKYRLGQGVRVNWCINRLEVYGNETEIARFGLNETDLGYEPETLRSPEMITVQFKTAWDPPSQRIERFAREFPGLHFDLYYYEPVSRIAGATEFAGGQIRRDEYYENDDQAVRDFVLEQFATDLDEEQSENSWPQS